MVDICIYGSYWLQYNIHPFSYLSSWNSDISNIIEDINIWLLLFALLNGFFEEFFFMGLVFAVGGRFKIMAIVASVLIRFGFHIYQGLPSALGIALMGLSFILVRQKYTSIVPFVLVHSLFDLFGAGVLFWIYSVGHF